ncbi:MAG: sensor domain-containing protein [Acidobacteriota bacterium]|nr:sensor domain-containing protein [Acidobacteriota bacterium]
MTATQLTAPQAFGSFFGVVAQGRSYLNALYLLLAFPLGVAYFCFLAVGWSLGLGLILLWVGFIVLFIVLTGSWLLSAFERQQAIHLLGADVRPMWPESMATEESVWARVKAFLANKVTWTGMVFLLLKFPLGVASFVVAVTSLSVSVALFLAPLYYRWDPPDLYWWTVDTLPEALVCSLTGALCLILTMHVLNGIAWLWGGLSRLLLGHAW